MKARELLCTKFSFESYLQILSREGTRITLREIHFQEHS